MSTKNPMMPKKIKTLTSRVVSFTGELAQAWIDYDAKVRKRTKRSNRRLTKSNVKAKVADMLNGCFVLTSQGLTVDHDGAVLDGQHTLNAVVDYYSQAGNEAVPIELYVTEGENPDNFPFYDQGKARSTADVLGIENINFPDEMSIAGRLLWIRTHGKRVNGAPRTPPYLIMEFIKQPKFKALKKSVEFIMEFGKGEDSLPCRELMSPGYAACLHFLMTTDEELKEGAADKFWTQVIDQDAEKGSPEYKLYRYIKKVKGDPNLKMDRDGLVNLIINAFNMSTDSETGSIIPHKGDHHVLGGLDCCFVDEEEVED
jgi:hypothetical protein